jgi:NTP pyrophosphatase (non-canonical NTP hydrolase)
MDLAQLQSERKVWADRNFPQANAEDHLIGVMEELGELAHANLKGRMKVRAGVNDGALVDAERDAVGDIVIYLTGYCSDRGFSIAECVERSWDEVKDRDWVSNPVDGKPKREETQAEKENRRFLSYHPPGGPA